jgi:hypothetical protein
MREGFATHRPWMLRSASGVEEASFATTQIQIGRAKSMGERRSAEAYWLAIVI